jgi:hypothetical protein
VQDERVNVRPKLGYQERHLVGHEAADEVSIFELSPAQGRKFAVHCELDCSLARAR